MCLRQSAIAFAVELVDLGIKTSNHLHRFVNGGTELVRFALPPPNAVDLRGPTAHLGFNLLAQLALCSCGNCLHDELHTARLANSVLLGTVLSEVAPLVIATLEAVLVVEAHVSDYKSWDV